MAADFGKDAACCRKGDSWDGEPSGKETKIGGLDAYVVEPPQPTKKAVLLIPGVLRRKCRKPLMHCRCKKLAVEGAAQAVASAVASF